MTREAREILLSVRSKKADPLGETGRDRPGWRRSERAQRAKAKATEMTSTEINGTLMGKEFSQFRDTLASRPTLQMVGRRTSRLFMMFL